MTNSRGGIPHRTRMEWLELFLECGTMKSAAKRAGLSTRTLQRRWRACGLNVRDVRIARRAAEILDLIHRDIPLKAVAARVGFNPQGLARFVRREFGLAPTALRQMLLGTTRLR